MSPILWCPGYSAACGVCQEPGETKSVMCMATNLKRMLGSNGLARYFSWGGWLAVNTHRAAIRRSRTAMQGNRQPLCSQWYVDRWGRATASDRIRRILQAAYHPPSYMLGARMGRGARKTGLRPFRRHVIKGGGLKHRARCVCL